MDRRDDDPDGLAGLSLDEAVAAVDNESADRGTVRETLAVVAEDGVVRREAVDDALADASKVVTTAETRVELAGAALADAREAADPVSEFDAVATRLDRFRVRVDGVEERAAAVGDRLRDVVERRDDAPLYDLAREIRAVTATAKEVQGAADDLQFELEEFEHWLDDPDRRHEELDTDADALAESLAELDDAVDDLATASEDGDAGGDAAGDPAVAWADATLRHRVAGLLLADLRSELASLREWADRETADPPAGVEAQLDELAATHEHVGDRLAALAEPDWRERFDERLAAAERELEGMEPPVEWGKVQAVVDEHRPDAGGE